MSYFVVVVPIEHMKMGYIVDIYPEERAAYLAEVATTGEVVVGEYATARQAHEALALTMMRTVGPMQ
jgi:hypothetical protein